MNEKYITMSHAQYILSINLILVPFIRLKISRVMAIYGYSFERMKALTPP